MPEPGGFGGGGGALMVIVLGFTVSRSV